MSEETAEYRVKSKNNPQNALAVEVLKQAVLQALYEQHRSGDQPYLGFNDIHDAIGIERIPNTKDYFVHGILLRLWQEDGYVEHFGSRGLWKITEKGISAIEAKNIAITRLRD